MEKNEIKHVIEAALLAAGRPLTLDQLRGLFGEESPLERTELRAALDELRRITTGAASWSTRWRADFASKCARPWRPGSGGCGKSARRAIRAR